MLKHVVICAALIASPALATQEYVLPTLFDVQGVAADDVLNIREAPSATATIIAALPPGATGVEVVATDSSGNWGQVNAGERAGWVSMRYLAYRSDVWQPDRLPAGMSCGGTEPFWSIRVEGGDLIWSAPDEELNLGRAEILDWGVFRDPRRAILVEDDHHLVTAAIMPAQCSDGMSDMAYGLEIMLIRQQRDQPAQMYGGCCLVAARPR